MRQVFPLFLSDVSALQVTFTQWHLVLWPAAIPHLTFNRGPADFADAECFVSEASRYRRKSVHVHYLLSLPAVFVNATLTRKNNSWMGSAAAGFVLHLYLVFKCNTRFAWK